MLMHAKYSLRIQFSANDHKKRQANANELKNSKQKNINRKYTHPPASNDSKNAIRLVASCKRAERIQLSSDNDTVAKSSAKEKQKLTLRGAFSCACALVRLLKTKTCLGDWHFWGRKRVRE